MSLNNNNDNINNNQSNRSSQLVTDAEKHTIMKNIETKTEQLVINATLSGELQIPLANTNTIETVDSEKAINLLQNFMQQGADEFEQKMGRHMTYSEMRQMFG